MPKNYKTYSKPGSFSEFQMRVPDQTAKIERQTQKQVRGLQRARQFQKENEEIYLRAQRLVNSAEEANRETNYRMQSLERQSYKDALDRDYKIRMDNLDAENKSRQTDLANISQFSQTAFNMVGQYLQEQEQKKIAAAHDVISRTGVTYDQMVAFQKMDDNLTRAEFAAQDSVQQMFGPDADTTLLDGMFAVYQNRNTKRWVEHKQLFQNSLNKFPDFLEEKIRERELETQQKITDPDAFLAEAKREFMEINFVGKARPEVLAGAGVYAKLESLVQKRRDLFLKDRRALQEKELAQDRQNAFAVAYNQDQVAGLIRWNSTDPSFQKREDLRAYLAQKAKESGAYALEAGVIDSILDYPGGGSNGKTLRESFPTFAAQLEEIETSILNRKDQDQTREDKAQQRAYDDWALGELDKAGADNDLTDAEVKDIEARGSLLYFGRESKLLQNARRITSDAQRWRQTKETNDALYKTGRLTMEIVMGGYYESPEAMNRAVNLAKQSDNLFADSTTQLHMSMIESTIMNSAEIRGAIKAYGPLNEVNNTLYVNKSKQNYKTYLQQFSAVPNTSFDKARDQALARVKVDIQNDLQNNMTDGAFNEFLIKSPDEQQKKQLSAAQTTGITQMNKIRDILRDTTKPAAQRYQLIAQQMNHAEIEKALTTYTEKQWNMPPVIAYVAETTNRNPLQVLNDIAQYIGDGKLTLQVDALNKEQKKRYSEFVVTPYSQIRNTFRTPERTGRANVGDTKTGASAPIRSSMFKVVQYVSGDPAIRGKSDGRIVYDNGDGPRGHGGKNYHNHYEFATQEQAAAAKVLFEQAGYRVTSYLRPDDTGSAHSRGVALDVAPPLDLPYTDEAEAAWSAGANALIGFDPLENE